MRHLLEKSILEPVIDLETEKNHNDDRSTNTLDRLRLEHALTAGEQFPRGLRQSFGYALSGIKEALSGERNFKIQLGCAAFVLILAAVLKVSLFSWLLLIQIISFVLTAELINTALEHLVDLASGGFYHPIARVAKDTAAGAVLVASFFALVSGAFIFIPYLLPFCHALARLSG